MPEDRDSFNDLIVESDPLLAFGAEPASEALRTFPPGERVANVLVPPAIVHAQEPVIHTRADVFRAPFIDEAPQPELPPYPAAIEEVEALARVKPSRTAMRHLRLRARSRLLRRRSMAATHVAADHARRAAHRLQVWFDAARTRADAMSAAATSTATAGLQVQRDRRRWVAGVSLFASGVAVGVLLTLLASGYGEADPTAQAVAEVPTQPHVAGVTPAAGSSREPEAVNGAGTSGSVQTLEEGGTTVDLTPLEVQRRSAYRGALFVNSRPSGATVFINNRLAGRTPLEMQSVPVGSRAVRVTLDGYDPWSRAISVVANQSTTVNARLEPVDR